MEPSSAMHLLSQIENILRKDQKAKGQPETGLRIGQRKVAKRFTEENSCTTQLPTGYGKTLTAAISYLLVRQRGIANRLLYIVPRGAQAMQAAEELPRWITMFSGTRHGAFIIGDSPIPALKAHKIGYSEIFITTVQALVSSPKSIDALYQMMATGQWMTDVDEYHHYGEDNTWTTKVMKLPRCALLAMSATPHRRDSAAPFGAPDPVVSYRNARKEGAVKPLRLHAYDYRVDAIIGDNEIRPFTTTELFREVGSDNPVDIDRWMASRQMRWSPRYISPLIMHPASRMADRGSEGIKSQMLVKALSCTHAEMVCKQIKALFGETFSVDWVGTGPNGRPDNTNHEILRRFCPPKNAKGIREWSLNTLVNVGMAGEGLDSVDVDEVVFLNSPKLNTTTMQEVGRASRNRPVPAGASPSIGTINVDASCELAKYLGDKVETCFDLDPVESEESDEEKERRSEREYKPLADKLVIVEVELVDIRTDPNFEPLLRRVKEDPRSAGLLREDLERWVEEALGFGIKKRDDSFNESAKWAQKKDMVESACRKLTYLVLKRAHLFNGSMRTQDVQFQDIVKRIKSTKNRQLSSRPESCSAEELDSHWKWLKQFEGWLLNNSEEIPEWLR